MQVKEECIAGEKGKQVLKRKNYLFCLSSLPAAVGRPPRPGDGSGDAGWGLAYLLSAAINFLKFVRDEFKAVP